MKKLVSFGEILLRLSTPGHQRFSQANFFDAVYGGSEANVLISAANFGKPCEFVSVLPDNDLGRRAAKELQINQVGVSYIEFIGKKLGLYFLEKGAINRGSKVIYDREYSAFANMEPDSFDWDEVFEDCDWFHWSGITPAVSENAAKACKIALDKAHERGITISGDLNYRGNLWQYDVDRKQVMSDLVNKTQVLLAGHYACKQFFDLEADNGSGKNLSQKLKDQFPELKTVAITNREEINASHNKWSAQLFSEGKAYESVQYDIYPVVDRVGTGDSFMGALIYGLQQFDLQKALDFAVAASCLKHSISGDVNRVTMEEVLKLVEGDRTGRINR